ncbi:MAG: hypothetical protein ACJ72L_13670 [Marmoricola sp.]
MEGEDVLAEAVEAMCKGLGDRLIGAYALGSLSHGGFSPLVSDIDLGLILRDPVHPEDAERIEAIAAAERVKGSELHARLSVFWGTPATLRGDRAGGRFPAPDRLDLIQSGRLLWGIDSRDGVPSPTGEELFVSGAEFALDRLGGVGPQRAVAGGLSSVQLTIETTTREVLEPTLLIEGGLRRVTKMVLFPIRFLYTAATGGLGTNDAAVDFHLAREAPAKALVAAAFGWRRGEPFEPLEATGLLATEMFPLYLFYLTDHEERLRILGRHDLAEQFAGWRSQLTRAASDM